MKTSTNSSHATGAPVFWRALLLALVFLCFVNPVQAETNSLPTLSSNRFLFVIDTSAGMKRKLPDILKEVDQVLNTAAGGQLHTGDTLGLWTYNQDVYAKFPLQTWGKIAPSDISVMVKGFMEHQRFTNTSHLEKALREMYGVMSASDVITVVLIYGGEPFTGTPFDFQIDSYLKANVKTSSGKGVPAVVVLESKDGSIMDYSVTASPWPIDFPPLPKSDPKPDAKPDFPSVAETVKPAAPAKKLPPLILSGPQSKPSASTPVQPVTPPAAPAEKTFEPLVSTNLPPPNVSTPMPPTPPAIETAITPITTPPLVAPTTIAQTTAQQPTEPAPKAVPPQTQSSETPALVTPPTHPTATPEVGPAAKRADATIIPPVNSAPLADVVSSTTNRPMGFLIVGLVLAIMAAVLIGLMLKRSSNKASESFISRSLAGKK